MRHQLFFLTAAIAVSLTSCKDDSTLNSEPNKSKSLSEFFTNNKTANQTFNISGDSSIVITGILGTSVTFPAGAFINANNDSVDGQIEIELIEVYKKHQFILSNVPTVTYDNKILKSAGAFYLKAKQNGGALNLVKPIELRVPAYQFVQGTSMELYYGIEANQRFQWFNAQNQFGGSNFSSSGTPSTSFYLGYINPNGVSVSANPFFDLGWLNCDDVISDTLPRTSITISVGTGHDSVNTATYIVFDDIKSVMRVYDIQNSNFVSPSNIPVTFNVTIVVITVEPTKMYLATKAITVEANHVEEVTPVEMSEDEVLSRLEELDD